METIGSMATGSSSTRDHQIPAAVLLDRPLPCFHSHPCQLLKTRSTGVINIFVLKYKNLKIVSFISSYLNKQNMYFTLACDFLCRQWNTTKLKTSSRIFESELDEKGKKRCTVRIRLWMRTQPIQPAASRSTQVDLMKRDSKNMESCFDRIKVA